MPARSRLWKDANARIGIGSPISYYDALPWVPRFCAGITGGEQGNQALRVIERKSEEISALTNERDQLRTPPWWKRTKLFMT
jgi:hypothetical protein